MKRLEIKNIVKTFPGVRALDNVSLDLHAGEVLGPAGREWSRKINFGQNPYGHLLS